MGKTALLHPLYGTLRRFSAQIPYRSGNPENKKQRHSQRQAQHSQHGTHKKNLMVHRDCIFRMVHPATPPHAPPAPAAGGILHLPAPLPVR